jgi:hypothetical protein
MSQIRYLVDQFDRATITGALDSVVVRDIALVRDSRIAIFQHPYSIILVLLRSAQRYGKAGL